MPGVKVGSFVGPRRQSGGGNVIRVDRSNATLRAGQQLAGTVDQASREVAEFHEKKKFDRERFESLNQLYELETNLALEQQKRINEMDPGAEGFARDRIEHFDKVTGDWLATVPESQKPAMTDRVARIRQGFVMRTAQSEYQERNRYQIERLGKRADEYAIAIRNNPEAFGSYKHSIDELMDASTLPEPAKAKLRAGYQRAFSLSWAEGLSPEEKIGFFGREGGVPEGLKEHAEGLQASDYDRLSNDAEREIKDRQKQRESAAKDWAWEQVANGVDPDEFEADLIKTLGSTHSSMRQMHKNLSKRSSPYAESSDKVELQKLLALPDGEIADADLRGKESQFTESDYARLVGRQEKAKQSLKELADDPKMSGVIERSLKQMASKGSKWGSAKASNTQRAEHNQIRDEMGDWVKEFIQKEGRKPNEDEVRSMAARLHSDTREGWFSGPDIHPRVYKDVDGFLEARGLSLSEDDREALAVSFVNEDADQAKEILGRYGAAGGAPATGERNPD